MGRKKEDVMGMVPDKDGSRKVCRTRNALVRNYLFVYRYIVDADIVFVVRFFHQFRNYADWLQVAFPGSRPPIQARVLANLLAHREKASFPMIGKIFRRLSNGVVK